MRRIIFYGYVAVFDMISHGQYLEDSEDEVYTGLARNSPKTAVYVGATVRASCTSAWYEHRSLALYYRHHGWSRIEPSMVAQLGGPGFLWYNI
jgi:hypothetical protein